MTGGTAMRARRAGAVLRESAEMARSSPVMSIMTILAVAAMCAAVLLTQGRAVGAREAVADTLDSAGSRTIVVYADPRAGVTTDVIGRIAPIDQVAWFGVFGQAADVTATAVPGGLKVPARAVYRTSDAPSGHDGEGHDGELGVPPTTPLPGQDAYASAQAMDRLGLVAGFGSVSAVDGGSLGVVGTLDTPAQLAFMEPLILVPTAATGDEPVGAVVLVAKTAQDVPVLADTVVSVLGVRDPESITVTTSRQLAELQAIVGDTLGTFGSTLVVGVLVLTALLVGSLLFGLVMMRRKDFGRRRALGASQPLLVALLLVQVAILAAMGAVVGTTAAGAVLIVSQDPVAPPRFVLAVALLAVVTAVVGGIAPAVAAARRDPLHEMRVP
ncbi:FtsX-like permease family protein [Isoptericola sp. NPDC057191]|uniref:FtsX-like permease family protein n=1 Tax=Isoptericola sp. NPDC057191 TaxID=3346041 RepID=UPI00363AA4EC